MVLCNLLEIPCCIATSCADGNFLYKCRFCEARLLKHTFHGFYISDLRVCWILPTCWLGFSWGMFTCRKCGRCNEDADGGDCSHLCKHCHNNCSGFQGKCGPQYLLWKFEKVVPVGWNIGDPEEDSHKSSIYEDKLLNVCGACGCKNVPHNGKFCPDCGRSIKCIKCNSTYVDDGNFCHNCGTQRPGVEAAPNYGEGREVDNMVAPSAPPAYATLGLEQRAPIAFNSLEEMASMFKQQYEAGSINDAVLVWEEEGSFTDVDGEIYTGRYEIEEFFTNLYDNGVQTFEFTILSDDGNVATGVNTFGGVGQFDFVAEYNPDTFLIVKETVSAKLALGLE